MRRGPPLQMFDILEQRSARFEPLHRGSAKGPNVTTDQIAAKADDGPTNDERASWAEIALLAFGQRTGLVKARVGDSEEPFFIISDLLADLAHWCDRSNVDLSTAITHAAQHYLAETDGAGMQFGR